jgi:GntR family transcriptional regulator, transcriptional repressor for pyruvate dehydrogenase complex
MTIESEDLSQGEPGSVQSATTRVVTNLRMLVDSGEFKPGEQLPPERELALRMKVSRSSLRAGIAFLGMIGVLKSCHGSGTYVSFEAHETRKLRSNSTLQPREEQGLVSLQLLEACCVIQGTLAGLAAERSSKRYLAQLAEELAEMYAALNDPEKYSIHGARFHRTIGRAAGNAILDALLETLAANIYNSRPYRAQPSQDLRQSAKTHHEIYRAIRSRNPIRAKLLMEQHLRGTLPFVETGANIHALPKWRSDIESVR